MNTKKIKNIFTCLENVREYADGVMPDTTFDQLEPSIRATVMEILAFIPAPAYTALLEAEVGSIYTEGLEYLRTAVANGALYKYSIFAAVKKNGGDASLYKYQYEEIKRHHIDAYWQAMDWLLSWFDTHAEEIKWTEPDGRTVSFADAPVYQERRNLPVKSAAEFDYYFGIDKSDFFFSKIVYLIRSVWQLKLLPLIRGSEDERVLDLAKRSLCYQVMAKAVMQFDVTELPRSVRYDFNHEYTQGTSMQSREKLYAQFMADVDGWTASIESLLAAGKGASALQTNYNREDNKHYTML